MGGGAQKTWKPVVCRNPNPISIFPVGASLASGLKKGEMVKVLRQVPAGSPKASFRVWEDREIARRANCIHSISIVRGGNCARIVGSPSRVPAPSGLCSTAGEKELDRLVVARRELCATRCPTSARITGFGIAEGHGVTFGQFRGGTGPFQTPKRRTLLSIKIYSTCTKKQPKVAQLPSPSSPTPKFLPFAPKSLQVTGAPWM